MAAKHSAQSLFREYGPLTLFALVTIGGMIFIWTAKLWGWSTLFATAVPLALMATYFLASVLLGGFRLQNEQAGDNLYYMGFLFTLSSLGVSLYLFTGETSIDTIVRNFGIAVTSTIAGVTLRILFNQMRRDPMDVERNVRHELVEMTRRVRTELDSSAREFSNYRRVSNQMLSEGFDEIARQAEKNGEDIRRAIDALSKQAIKPVQEAAEKLSSIIESHHKSLDERTSEATTRLTETTTQLSVIIDQFAASVEEVSKRLEAIRPPDDIIKIELTPAIDAIKEMTEAHLRRIDDGPIGQVDTEQTRQALPPLLSLEAKLDRIASILERPATTVISPTKPDGPPEDEGRSPALPETVEGSVEAKSISVTTDMIPPEADISDQKRDEAEGDGKRWFKWQRT